MQFSLSIGLQVRRDKQILQLVRLAAEGELVFENVSTKLPVVLKRHTFVKDVWEGKTQVVWSEVEDEREGNGQSAPRKATNRLTDYSSLPEKDRKLLEYRLAYVKGVGKSRVRRGQRAAIEKVIARVAASLADNTPPSASTVMVWIRRFEKNDLDPSSLLSMNRARKKTPRTHPKVDEVLWKVLRTEYFTRSKHSARHAYKVLRRQLKKLVSDDAINAEQADVSYPTLCRRIKEVDLYHRVATREGEARARMECRTAFPHAVPSYAYQSVEIDHSPLNWIVICDRTGLPLGRPLLTLASDGFSSYPLGFYVSFYGPGVTSVSGVIRNAVMPKDELISNAGLTTAWIASGLGDMFVVDNGLEFHSGSFSAMALTLGVDIMYCRVRTPWLKPRVERFFAELNTLTLARGRISKVVTNVSRIDPDKDAVITFSDFVKGLLKFLVEVYPHQKNWRKMATPYELFADGIKRMPPATYPGSMDEFRLASGLSKELMLGKGGIELEGIPYGSYAFKEVVNRYGPGKVLCKWDPDDMSELYFMHPVEKRWHSATSRWPHHTTGLSYNQHRLIKRYADANYRSSGREEAYEKAYHDLSDFWLNATGKRSRADSQLAGRFSGVTSANVLTPSVPEPGKLIGQKVESKVVLPGELPFNMDSVPEFGGFTL